VLTVNQELIKAEEPIRQLLRTWFEKPPGINLLQVEQIKATQYLADLFGYHIVQLGCLHDDDFISASRISHKLILQLDEQLNRSCRTDAVCCADALALASDSMDVVFMPHVLEYTSNPHRLLREVERILIGDGHLVIIGFNPWSLWGLWRIFHCWRKAMPWRGHFFGLARIKDWLSLLDLELIRMERFFFRPPLRNGRLMNRLGFLESLGKNCWPWFGSAYIIIARKRLLPLTSIKMRWRDKRRIISGIAEPSTRVGDA
jgi:SAM-dependent methyltransferase